MRIRTTIRNLAAVACTALPLASLARSAIGADLEAGAKVFNTQCSSCHGVVEGKKGLGPGLFGVVGREAGRVPDFRYSEATKTSGLTWNEANLDRYLANPRAVIPGTTMPYAGLKNDTQRIALIAYLAGLK